MRIATASSTHNNILVASVAVAGSVSMAAGEYVSVHSQADTEKAEVSLEQAKIKSDDVSDHRLLAAIQVLRGLDAVHAKQVAQQLMAQMPLARMRAMNWA